jgi:hypothetical protein
MDIKSKVEEASELLTSYLDHQTDADRPDVAFGALRTSAIVLWETCGQEAVLEILAGISAVLKELPRPTAH